MKEFECRRCGNCCKRNLGWVYATSEEIEDIAEYLEMSVFDFMNKYIIKDRGWLILSSPTHNQNCFLENDLCTIYPVRPLRCQEYPVWENILQDRNVFLSEAKLCKGLEELVNKQV